MANEPKQSKPDEAKNYRVVKGSVGDWDKGAVFSLDQFKGAHPLDEKTANAARLDRDSYHNDLIERLVALDVIQPTAVLATSVPSGPHNYSGAKQAGNQSIRDATRAAREQKVSRQAAVNADVQDRSAVPAVQTQPALSNPARDAQAREAQMEILPDEPAQPVEPVQPVQGQV